MRENKKALKRELKEYLLYQEEETTAAYEEAERELAMIEEANNWYDQWKEEHDRWYWEEIVPAWEEELESQFFDYHHEDDYGYDDLWY